MTYNRFETVRIAGQHVHVAGREDLQKAVVADYRDADGPRGVLVFDANGQGVSLRARSQEYKEAVDQADIVHADGEFIVRFSRFFSKNKHITDRSVTTDVIHDFAKVAAENGLSFFLLGGPEGLARDAAYVLEKMYPRLEIVGTRNGYFEPSQEEQIIEEINDSGADIVWVGLGKPKEQLFCARHKGKFKSVWIITCGGCFAYLTGEYGRAPLWMQKNGLEWLYRMFTTKGLFGRYLFTTPHALYLAITKSSET